MVVDDQLKLSADRLRIAGGPLRRPQTSWDAPETAAEKITPAADLWSLGVVLVQALTQKPPLWDKAQGAEPEVPAAIPQPFFAVARECLRVDPARRMTLSGVKAQLEPAQTAEPVARSTGKTTLQSRRDGHCRRAIGNVCGLRITKNRLSPHRSIVCRFASAFRSSAFGHPASISRSRSRDDQCSSRQGRGRFPGPARSARKNICYDSGTHQSGDPRPGRSGRPCCPGVDRFSGAKPLLCGPGSPCGREVEVHSRMGWRPHGCQRMGPAISVCVHPDRCRCRRKKSVTPRSSAAVFAQRFSSSVPVP